MASTIVKIPKTTPYTLAGSHCGDWIMDNGGAVEVMFVVTARLRFWGRLIAILASSQCWLWKIEWGTDVSFCFCTFEWVLSNWTLIPGRWSHLMHFQRHGEVQGASRRLPDFEHIESWVNWYPIAIEELTSCWTRSKLKVEVVLWEKQLNINWTAPHWRHSASELSANTGFVTGDEDVWHLPVFLIENPTIVSPPRDNLVNRGQ